MNKVTMDIKCRIYVYLIQWCTLLLWTTNAQSHRDYTGTCGNTIGGRTCQRWDKQSPQAHSNNSPSRFPDATLEDAGNYCRDPDGTGFLWCYTTDSSKRWEQCNVQNCPVNEEPFCTKWPAIDVCRSGSITTPLFSASSVYIDTGRVPANTAINCFCYVTVQSATTSSTADLSLNYKVDGAPGESNLAFCGQNFKENSDDSMCSVQSDMDHMLHLGSDSTRTRACLGIFSQVLRNMFATSVDPDPTASEIRVTCYPNGENPKSTTTTTVKPTTTTTPTTTTPTTTTPTTTTPTTTTPTTTTPTTTTPTTTTPTTTTPTTTTPTTTTPTTTTPTTTTTTVKPTTTTKTTTTTVKPTTTTTLKPTTTTTTVKPSTTTTTTVEPTTSPSVTTTTSTKTTTTSQERAQECSGPAVVHVCTNSSVTAPSVTMETSRRTQYNVTSCVCHVGFTNNVRMRYTPHKQAGASTLHFCGYNFTNTYQEETCSVNGSSLNEVRFESNGNSIGACLDLVSARNMTVTCYAEDYHPSTPQPTGTTGTMLVGEEMVYDQVGLATVVGSTVAGIMFATIIIAAIVVHRRKKRKFVVRHSLYGKKERSQIEAVDDTFKEEDIGEHKLTAIRVGYRWIKNRMYWGQSGDFSLTRVPIVSVCDDIHEENSDEEDNTTVDVDEVVQANETGAWENTLSDYPRTGNKEKIVEVTDDFVFQTRRTNDIAKVENNNRKSIFLRIKKHFHR